MRVLERLGVGVAGVFTLIRDEADRVLLCHRRDLDLWNMPGGALEPAEAPWDGAAREVKEEVGFDVEIIRLVGLYWKEKAKEIVFQFEGAVVSGHPSTSEEADDVRYFGLNELPENLSPSQRERIEQALADHDHALLLTQGHRSSRDLLRDGEL
ncbi:MAG: NUDIX domain-containing protein [Nitriliruptorales bacterium]|nr:NUDIX domain-containing protein [Nitriliruptorales bacterium]